MAGRYLARVADTFVCALHHATDFFFGGFDIFIVRARWKSTHRKSSTRSGEDDTLKSSGCAAMKTTARCWPHAKILKGFLAVNAENSTRG